MTQDLPSGITTLLRLSSSGDKRSTTKLLRLVYPELKRIASALMRGERHPHTLQPTALIHEAFIRLFGECKVDYQNRAHFFSTAAAKMRHILTDHARRKFSKRHGGSIPHVLPSGDEAAEDRDLILTVLTGQLLGSLELTNPRLAAIVDLRFFAGLTETEIAGVLNISLSTVQSDWWQAKQLLREMLNAELG